MLSFKSTFSLSSFTFIKRFFSSLLSAISVVSFAYLRLLTFLLTILIPACASSSPAFHMMYSAQCTWVWVNSGSWRWTGRLGMLQSKGSKRVGHDWVTKLNSGCKLNKQGDNIQPWCTPFPIWWLEMVFKIFSPFLVSWKHIETQLIFFKAFWSIVEVVSCTCLKCTNDKLWQTYILWNYHHNQNNEDVCHSQNLIL